MPSKDSKYRSVSVLKTQIELIEKIIEEYPELRYKSVSHFVDIAIRTNTDYKTVKAGGDVADLVPKINP